MDPGAKLGLISMVQSGRKDGDKDREGGSGLVKGTGLGTRALLLPKPSGFASERALGEGSNRGNKI